MNSRERVLCAINHEPVDRVPTDIWSTPEVLQRLADHFGDLDIAFEQLHIDRFHGVGPIVPEQDTNSASGRRAGRLGGGSAAPARNARVRAAAIPFGMNPLPYSGPPIPDGCDIWGIRTKTIRYETGEYEEQANYPLAWAQTIDDLEQYRWPRADWFDLGEIRAVAQAAHETHAVECGYLAPFYLHNGLRGLERSMIDPHDDPAFTRHLLDRLCGYLYDLHLRIFETCEGLIDVCAVHDDYGSQTGPLISLRTFREFYKPHLKRFIDLCHGFGIKVFHHDDGAIRPFLPELIEMGIDILNPIQWSCPGMELAELKRDFGADVCFHGAVENQRIVPFGTVEEVRAEVRKDIDILASDGTGYILAPCHNLQPVTPIENIIALYDEAYHYGRFTG